MPAQALYCRKGHSPLSVDSYIVIISGRRRRLPVNSIHQLVSEQWVEIGSMSRGRWQCLVVSPSPDKMMIVGGAGAADSVKNVLLCFSVYHVL